MNALFSGLLILGTAVFCVALGVFGAYCALTGLLSILNPGQPKQPLAVLVPRESSASGD